MDQTTLLSNGTNVSDHQNKKAPFVPSLAKCALKFLMWVVLLIWLFAIFFNPSPFVQDLMTKFINSTRGTAFEMAGSVFLGFSAPILIIALLAYVYISAFPNDHVERKNMRSLSFRVWTFPIIVDGPFGVVSIVEFTGILLFIALVLWQFTFYAIDCASLVSKLPSLPNLKSYFVLELLGVRFGSIGLFCLIFLFLPVARGSVLLRLIDIPFEHATKYHVWLGHLTMIVFTLHGLFFVISWGMQGNLRQQLAEWADEGIANLPGVISLAAGLVMWVTSLQPVRKKFFELFFYTHQLYIVFVVFLALHVGDFIFSFVAGAVFLFLLDRFVRFCQSRTKVDVISASCRPCGTVELVFSKPARLRYNALSFIFIQVRELSFLQWHPFSVSSSPQEGRFHISVLIKALGGWTGKLKDLITTCNEQQKIDAESQSSSSCITACVEGPYGHESPYHLMYEDLILVAGGIGISPFLAILSDILHRIDQGAPCLPKTVLVIWAVKRSKELSLLTAVDMQSIRSTFINNLKLNIQAYVTQESEPPLEEGKVDESSKMILPTVFAKNGTSMSSLVGTGSALWSGMYFTASTIGFIAFYGIAEVYYLNPFGVSFGWQKGLLLVLSMVAGVVLAGGAVLFFWHLSERRQLKDEKWDPSDEQRYASIECVEPVADNVTSRTSLLSFQATQYGCRPNFKDIFTSFSEKEGNVDVGVMVCGPLALQSSVAKECRAQNLRRRKNQALFHFNSHTFDL